MRIKKAKKGPLLGLLLLLPLVLHGSYAAQPAPPYSDALLWKVTTGKGPVNYIFGTIHSDDPRVMQLPPKVRQALADSERLMLEIVLTPEAMNAMMQAMMRWDQSTLKQDLPEPLYKEAVEALKARGVQPAWAERFTVWAAAVTLMMPKNQSGLILDGMLQAQAEQQQKPVLGLETVDSQMDIFAKLPKESQLQLLRIAVGGAQKVDELYEQLIQAYLREDLAAIIEMSKLYENEDRAFMQPFMRTLLDQRNTTMVQAMRKQLERGRTFVAVGALHLPGEAGIMQLLQQAGYKIEAVR
jgi:uncharacterized protein YbaP (TraB family)